MLQELYEISIRLKDELLEFLPRALLALGVLIVGYLLARLMKYLVIKLVRRVSRLVNNRSVQNNLDHSAAIFGIVIFWFVILFTILLMSEVLEFTIVTTGIESLLQYSPNLLAAGLTIFVAYIFGKFVANLIASVSARVGIAYGRTLGRIVQYAILGIAIVIAIDQVGIDNTIVISIINIVLAALLFGAALAFALGAKDSISNIVAAFYVRKMYKEGDEIRIGEVEGRITKFDATAVVLDTEHGQCVIPAKEFNERNSFLLRKD